MLYNNIRKTIMMGMATAIIATSFGATAFAGGFDQSFEDFMREDVKIDGVSVEDLQSLENIYEEVKNVKHEERREIMIEFYKIAAKYDDCYENYGKRRAPIRENITKYEAKEDTMTFEEYNEADLKLKTNTPESIVDYMKTLYEKAQDLRKDGKIKQAEVLMKKLWDLAKKYD
jgi:hypothetical protein